eukprot:Filipodium_phascolosomae@DN904_c0_g1_i1.p1
MKNCLQPHTDVSSKVAEIVLSQQLIYVLLEGGNLTAYSRLTSAMTCQINCCPNKIVRTIFFNKYNESLLLVYTAPNSPGTLKCSVYCEDSILKGDARQYPTAWRFCSHEVRYPGFLE